MCTATAEPHSARQVVQDLILGNPVTPEAVSDMRDAYGSAEESPANIGVRVIAKKLEEIERLADEWTDTHNDKCECAFCVLCTESERPWIYENLLGIIWSARMVYSVLDGSAIGGLDPVALEAKYAKYATADDAVYATA